MNKKIIFIIVFICIISITFISLGLYINSLSKPKKILERSISFIHDEGKKYIFSNDDLNIGDTYTSTSSIDFNLNSEYYSREGKTDSEALKKSNYIKNISKMDTNLIIKQDKSTKTNYIDLSQKIGNENIVGYKRLVTNSTEYYFVNGIVKNYVNNGACNYFEALSEENTTRSNINYLYDFIFKSLNKNLKDEYFENYDVVQNINYTDIKVHQISLRFDNKITRKILNDILKDLKKDEKANNILSNVYKDFKKYKVKDNKTFFEKEESYTLNIYTTKFLSRPLKYEVIHLEGDSTESYIIEKNKDVFNYYYLEDGNAVYSSDIKVLDNSISGKIYNSSSNEVGELLIEKNGNNLIFNYTFDDNNKKIDLKYNSNYDKVKKHKSYTNIKKLTINYLVNKEIKLAGNIEYTNKVENKAKIDEEIGNSTLYSKLSDNEKNLIKNKRENVKLRLEK